MKNVLLFGLIALVTGAGIAVPASAQRSDRPSSALNFGDAASKSQATTPGDGYMVGGDIWNTLKPANTSEAGRLGNAFATVGGGMNNRLLFGSRGNWQEPTGSWPSGYPWTNTFRNSHFMAFPMFKASGWPGYGAGNAVRAKDAATDVGGTGGTSRFMFATYGPDVPGASDATRNYKRPARYVDQARTHLVYESGWPTSSGVDFKVRAHQFTPNTQNLNDFTVLEISLTNTGNVDSDGNGTIDATGNVIDGVSMMLDATVSPSIQLSVAGDRGCNCIAAGRTFGYIAAPDATGAPYNMWAWFANVSPTQTANLTVPPAGQRSFGIDNTNQLLGYSDIWNAWNFMGVKQGAISDTNLGAITAASPDKPTRFGSHSVGTGAQRGWYTSVQWQSALSSLNASDIAFRNATATWYQDYGKLSNGGAIPTNLNANSNFFAAGGTAGDITTWTPLATPGRPNGDFKNPQIDLPSGVSGIEQVQPVWEPAWNSTAASGDFYNGTKGFAREYTFGQSLTQGIGPFDLQVGESITIVWVAAAGFRMEGVTDAVKSANWAWNQGWNIDTALPTPAAPDINVESTTAGTARIRWTDVSSIRPVDGYKVWRSAQYKRTSYQDVGMRLQDRYQEQQTPGAVPANLLDARNPNFDAFSIFTGAIQGSYQPAEWGTYDLIKTIPNGELSQFTDANGGYQYSFEDEDAITGFTYWYYVSAYKEGSFTGPQGAVTRIESSNMNRNGRNDPTAANGQIGLGTQWGGTYPYAFRNAQYPTNPQALKNLGVPFTVTPPVAAVADVADLITVSPNPYKITGLNDNRNDAADHTINFLNTPAEFKLTIMDVSGQLVWQGDVESAPNGLYQFRLFSKDGVEISSGLYIYHIQYGTDESVTGTFAIIR